MIRSITAIAAMFMLLLTVLTPAASAHDDGSGIYNQKGEAFEELLHDGLPGSDGIPKRASCIDGMAAGIFECNNIDLMSHLSPAELGLSFVNDIWGWTDSSTGREYALVGGIEGTVFVDVTGSLRPRVVGILPTATSDQFFWRDIRVYRNVAYVVSEDTDHGLQVFDLRKVRNASGAPKVFEADRVYDGFGSAHNVLINEQTGFLYAVGTLTCEGGLHMVDLSLPRHPQFAGCVDENGYVHDAQCVIYKGPDREHKGKEICFNSVADFDPNTGELSNSVAIVDVSNKRSPKVISNTGYEDAGYSHQGWLRPDQKYFLHNDELDEFFGLVDETTTRVWDIADLDAPVVTTSVGHGTPAVNHNNFTRGARVYQSNYTAGLQVFDTTQLGSGQMDELAFFDVYPENDDASFEGGTWGNYPYFNRQGKVAVSSMDRGLFILQVNQG